MSGQEAQGSGKGLEVKQFRYSSDNLGYLIYTDQHAVAVDGGAVKDILSFLKSNNISLQYITNTHSHSDHTIGNQQLLKNTEARFIDYRTLLNKGIELDNKSIDVIKTPGHTVDSVIFKVNGILLTGDTLFIGKVGRCFSGDLKVFLNSIKQLVDLPDNIVIYPGHDYVLEYMEFVRSLDPENQYINTVTSAYHPDLVKSTLGLEKKLNPFLRINDKNIISILEKRGLPAKTEYVRWESLISLM